MPYRLAELYNDIAELAARAAGSSSAMLVERIRETSEARIIGHYGAFFDPPNGKMPTLVPPGESFRLFKDISTDPRLAGHPVLKFYPAIRSLFIGRITPETLSSLALQHTLVICNLPEDFWENSGKLASVSHVLEMCRKYMSLLAHQLMPDPQPEESLRTMDVPNSPADHADPASRFLFETLIRKQSLHERNGHSYVTLRTWRKTIKPHQLDALIALKQDPPKRFVDEVTTEMAERAIVLFGKKTIKSVVPVPGGSSGKADSLSVQIAESLAGKLQAHFSPILRASNTAKTGKSHPKKSSSLQPYVLLQKPKGVVLLVDDVVSSGRHIELAQMALRSSGAACFALGWIGP